MKSKLTEMEEKILRTLEPRGYEEISCLNKRLRNYSQEVAWALGKLLRKSFIEIQFSTLLYSKEIGTTVDIFITCKGIKALQNHQNQKGEKNG